MAYAEFTTVIQSEHLRAVAHHWNEARNNRPLPGWNDIKPSQMPGQLKYIWVYRYDRATRLFTGRLAGNVIEQVFGKSFRGTPMTEIYPPSDYPRLYARAERVVCEPAFYHGEGRVFRHLDRIGNGERIMLPLADDGHTGDGVLGATVYQTATNPLSLEDAEFDSWYPL